MQKVFRHLIVLFSSLHTFLNSECQQAIPSFEAPDTVCLNAPVGILNTSVGASSYYWTFCSADLNTVVPETVNLGNISGNLSHPTFMDYGYLNNNYYGFIMDHMPGGLVRLDFGNSLLNTPTSVNLGDFGGIIPSANGSEGIQLVQENGKWYAIIVGGNIAVGTSPRILKIEFGADLSNPAPVATDWGNLGNLDQPIDLHIFQEGSDWHGFTVNAENNTITRFDFENGINNPPTAANLGNPGNIKYPTGIYALNDNGYWRVFITSAGDDLLNTIPSSLVRLDFGNSLLNTPNAINLGDLNGKLHRPRDFTLIRSCGETIAFIVNQTTNDIVKLNFNQDLTSTPEATSFGNLGNFDFPHSITKLFRVNENVYGFVPSSFNNTLTRLKFLGCSNSGINHSAAKNPSNLSYNTPGVYNINLTIDDGLPSQSSFCKQVVVLDPPHVNLTADTSVCANSKVQLHAGGGNIYTWAPETGLDNPTIPNPIAFINGNTIYTVKVSNNYCSNSGQVKVLARPYPKFTASPDQEICLGASAILNAGGGDAYTWNPTAGLDNRVQSTTSANPNTTTTYTVYIQDNICGYDTTINTRVIVHELPIVNATKSNDITCTSLTSRLTATGANSYLWTPSIGLDNSYVPNPIASIDNTTHYEVTGSNEFGCSSTTSITLAVRKEGEFPFSVPNAFTPNGDQINDHFGLSNIGRVQISQFTIYNIWGQIVFQTTNPTARWDGTFKGRPQNEGNYVYLIKGHSVCGEINKKGSVLLIR